MATSSEPRFGPDPAPADVGSFPVTRYSVVRSLGSGDAEVRGRAYETLVASYWKPVYKYVRLRWHSRREDAEDLTQDFFTQAFDKHWLEKYDPSRSRFRTFLRTCVDGSVAHAQKAANRLKRGGGLSRVPMDFADAELELRGTELSVESDVDDFFRREWVRAVFELAIRRLRTECARLGKATHFALFERYDIQAAGRGEVLTYAALAKELGLPDTQVTNYLAFARRRFRQHVLDALHELTVSEEEFAAEALELLGIKV